MLGQNLSLICSPEFWEHKSYINFTTVAIFFMLKYTACAFFNVIFDFLCVCVLFSTINTFRKVILQLVFFVVFEFFYGVIS